jgi:N-carbamoyl-L-amino-acid hydrolase
MSEGAPLRVDGDRLIADLQRLGEFGRNDGGGIDRASFSAADIAARRWLTERCESAGLHVRVDGIGNLVISSPVLEEGLAEPAPVWTGSHIDAVPNGGMFDGPLGSLAAIECLRRLHEERLALRRPVRAVVFADEEGNYAHLLGSSGVTRGYTADQLASFVGRDGDAFVDSFRAFGGDVEAATGAVLAPGSLHATVELHIEQGPVLERSGIQIGVVTGIVAIGGGTVRFLGQADHAGTTPMAGRRDAVVAAADFVTRLPALAARASADAVVTAGIIRVEPGGSNVIAHAAEVVVDYRDPTVEGARTLHGLISEAASGTARSHDVDVEIEWEELIADAPMHDLVRSAVRDSAAALGLTSMGIASGAGHDSQNLARLAPTGMIFVPSTQGRSHSPAESTPWSDVVNGADTLLGTLVRLAGASPHE